MVYALTNAADLDYGNTRAKVFEAKCPDGGKVILRGERIDF